MSSNPAPTALRRSLGLWAIVGLGLGYMTPMTVFDTFGIVTGETNGVVPSAYLFALVAMVFTAVSYGRMTRVFPSAGSAYTYASETIHPNVGFLVGWSSLLDYLLLPLVNALTTAGHINPVHMGVVLIATLAFGLITPPYGLVLLMASKFVGVRFSQALRAALPIYAVFLITIVFIIFFPEVVLWIPKQVLPQSVGCFHNPSGAGFICPNG